MRVSAQACVSLINNLSVHEQSQCEGHSQAPVGKVLLAVHSDVGVARRETHEQGSFAGHAVKRRPALVLWLSEVLQYSSEKKKKKELAHMLIYLAFK